MPRARKSELNASDYVVEFRPDIQAVRGLAVLLVVLYHADIPGFHGGFLGVDIFFVISGFVITNVLLREKASDEKISIPRFYSRRIRRILPAATVVILGTLFATYHWLSYIAGAANGEDAKYVTLFVGNFRFAELGTQYFTASQPPSTLQQFWSLAVEEQFYLVWPIIFLLVVLPWRLFSPVIRLNVVLTLIIGSSLTWCILETSSNEVLAFFSPLTRAWELALGALLAVAGPRLRQRSEKLGLVLTTVGFVVIFLCTWFYSSSTSWPGTAVIAPVVATGMIIAGGSLRGPRNFHKIYAFRPVQWLGDISYSLYLVHWPIIAIATQYAFSPLPLRSEIELVALSLLLSVVLYNLVENPIRRSRIFGKSQSLTFSFGAAMLAVTFIVISWHLSHY